MSDPEPLTIRTADEHACFSLRIALKDLRRASDCFGCTLPEKIGAISTFENRMALCLGPDEWQLYARLEEAGAIEAKFAAIYPDCTHSLVNVSDREISIDVKGSAAEQLLASGCALDLTIMPSGTGTRTIFDKVPIILIKFSDYHYRIGVWRSFGPYLWEFLSTASFEIQFGI